MYTRTALLTALALMCAANMACISPGDTKAGAGQSTATNADQNIPTGTISQSEAAGLALAAARERGIGGAVVDVICFANGQWNVGLRYTGDQSGGHAGVVIAADGTIVRYIRGK